MVAKLSVKAGQYSDAGVKPLNEDACGIRVPEPPLLNTKGLAVVIADGVSRSEGGREASEACVQGFLNDYYSTPESWSVKTAGQRVLGALNRWLCGRGQRRYAADRAMVTTLSVLVLKSGTAHIFHIGDTRIYRHRDGELECLTRDHRLWVSDEKSFLSRAMGAELNLEIDYRSLPIETDDTFVLLTDGIHEYLGETELKILIEQKSASPEQAARLIVKRALENGSHDNVTCQILQVTQLPQLDEDDFYQQLTELPFPPPLEAGMVMDAYRVAHEIHASRRTQVYLAQEIETGRQVVIKTPSVNFEDDPTYIDQFLHEEWVGRRIHSPHVLKVMEPAGRRRFLYYVTEYLEGQTLRSWMTQHPRPDLRTVRNLVDQLITGLRAFHRLEMVHRDLKPENILIDATQTVKIIDFGSTKIAGIEEIQTPYERNALLGTLDYAAPEYFEGYAGSPQSDIFALGVITYEMLTGRLPYGSALSARRLKRATYTSIKHYHPEVPAWVDEAVRKAVHLDTHRRYRESSEFIQDLSKPNSEFMHRRHIPLIERSPIAVWKGLAALSILINIVLVYILSR